MQKNDREEKYNQKHIMDEKDLNVDKIAELIGVSSKLLHKKLRNKGEFRLDEAMKLVDALGIRSDEVDEFLFPEFCETLKKAGDCL